MLMISIQNAQKIRTKGDTEYQARPSATGWEAEACRALRSEDTGGRNGDTEVPNLDGVGQGGHLWQLSSIQ